MLSALKKLTLSTGKHEEASATPPGLQTMSKLLQNKFSKGVQYNMKIIIKGDRNVGKTCLFNRLQGRSFVELYTPSEEIQVTNIQWNYKATDDIVKVEVWDVVDKGRKRVLSDNLKLHEEVTPALDAEFVDVYKGTNGVIMVMDVTKNWTFEYIQREITAIPGAIPVLVLGNHCDMSHHRTVTPDHVLFFLETLQRSSPARYAESSMSNGFGLKFLHKWFNLPFLQLQRETLLAQLVTNENEIAITAQELDLYQQTDDSNYKIFLEKLTNYRRKVAESNAAVPTSSLVIQTKYDLTKDNSLPPVKNGINVDSIGKEFELRVSQQETNAAMPNTEPKPKAEGRITGGIELKAPVRSSVNNIEEFVPDEYLDKSFLEDTGAQTGMTAIRSFMANDSDSDHENIGNPLVSEFQDDLDPQDSFCSLSNNQKLFSSQNWALPEGRGSPDGDDDVSGISDGNVISKINPTTNESLAEGERGKKKSKKKNKVNRNEHLEKFLNQDYEALG